MCVWKGESTVKRFGGDGYTPRNFGLSIERRINRTCNVQQQRIRIGTRI